MSVGGDLLLGQHRALGRAPAGIADARRVVADDQDHHVPRVLKGAKLVQHHHVPQVDVGGGGVDPQLHPQRPARLELLGQTALGQGLDGALESGAAPALAAAESVTGPMLD